MSDFENVEELTSEPEETVVQSEPEPVDEAPVEPVKPVRKKRTKKVVEPKTRKVTLIKYGSYKGHFRGVVYEVSDEEATRLLALRQQGGAIYTEVFD